MDREIELKIKELREKVSRANEDYYNGIESMSNFEYDKLYDELKELEEKYDIDNKQTDFVGASVDKTPLQKVTHEYEAKSLGKTKSISDLIKEQNKAEGDVCVSWKMDGSTVVLEYNNGKLTLAATRGDGKIGQDITRNVSFIKGIPNTIPYTDKLVVRGEAFMTYEDFDSANKNGEFANPRNLAAATITALDTKLLEERPVSFKAFELVNTKGKSFSKELDFLSKLGFGVVEHEKVSIQNLNNTIRKWSEEDRIKNLGFPVDGLVIMHDDRAIVKDLSDTGHHPNLTKGMAFKWQDETVETILRKIEWSASRTGLLNPVAVFDTVDLCGTKVSRASLHNVSYVEGLNLKVGDRITVYKANMIIPQIAENLDREKEGNIDLHIECPCCHSNAKIEENNGVKTAICENEKCLAKELGAFTHFVEKHGMNIEGLSEKTIMQLMETGFLKDISDLYRLKDHLEIAYLPGFGKKSFDNLVESIEKSKNCDLAHFLYACGIDSIGRGQIKEILNYLKNNYDDLCGRFFKESDKDNDGEKMFKALLGMVINNFDFTDIPNIGDILANNFVKFMDDEFIFPMEENISGRYKDCLPFIEFTDILSKGRDMNVSDSVINGKSFCITGKLEHFENRDAMVSFIEEHGGKFVSSVSKNTDYLINNDINSTSSKNKKANSLNIPIISENDFLELVKDKDEVKDEENDYEL